jgi:predicted N-acetyltransferase YhbS
MNHACDIAISQITIRGEHPGDEVAREAMLDAAMGPDRRKKASEALRRNRRPADGLALIAEGADGRVLASVRLWPVMAGGLKALLLGPLAVDKDVQSSGLGSRLMRIAIAEASFRGHGAILLVGDAPYYARFGFSAARTADLTMPGEVDPARFLALELKTGHLAGATGAVMAAGHMAVEARRHDLREAA